MSNCKRLKGRKGICRSGILCTLLIGLLSVPAMAADATTTISGLDTAFNAVFISGRAIGLPIAAVAIAAAGFMFMGGNEKMREQAKTLIKVTLIALAAYLILPLVIQFAYGLAQNFAWNPDPDGNSVIVPLAPAASPSPST